MSATKGFTLVELVIVILLLGIVAAYVVPKWLGTGGAQIRTTTDELASRLRLVQLMNMNEPSDRCSYLRIESGRFGHISTASCAIPGAISSWSSAATSRGRLVSFSIPVTLNSQSTVTLRFDRQSGKACTLAGCPSEGGAWLCPSGCNIVVGTGGEARTVRIESEGYIHALP